MSRRRERQNLTNMSKVVVSVEKGVLHVVSVMASFSKVFCDLSIGLPLLLSRQFFSFTSRKPFFWRGEEDAPKVFANFFVCKSHFSSSRGLQ